MTKIARAFEIAAPSLIPKRNTGGAGPGSLLEHPLYPKVIERYRRDFARYVREVHNYSPTWQQEPVMEACNQEGFQISVVSGHGTGKSRLFASFIDFNLRIFPYSNLILTGPNLDQIKKVVWKELEGISFCADVAFSWWRGYFEMMAESYFYKDNPKSWFASPKTAPIGRPENIAGMHNQRYVILVDEASGVDDAILAVLRGGLTEQDNCMMMVSQGTRNTGTFYESHHQNRQLWSCFHMDSELSPRVTKKFIRERLIEYGGFHSVNYQIKVKGAFPNNLAGYLIPRAWAEKAADRSLLIEHDTPPGVVISVDVARDGRDSSVLLVARVSGYKKERRLETLTLKEFPHLGDTMKLAQIVYDHWRQHESASVIVDSIGVGKGVCDRLAELGVEVQKFRGGDGSFEKKQYFNKRAESYWWLREGIFDQMVKLSYNTKLFDQLANLPYAYSEAGQFKMMKKEEMAKKGIKSPDLVDAYTMAMLAKYRANGAVFLDEDEEVAAAKSFLEQLEGGLEDE